MIPCDLSNLVAQWRRMWLEIEQKEANMNKVPSCIVCVDVSIWLHSTLEANDVEYLINVPI